MDAFFPLAGAAAAVGFIHILRHLHRRRAWAISIAAQVLRCYIDAAHPYNTTAAYYYRHFDKRTSLDELAVTHPPGCDWNGQFRFTKR